MPTKSFKNRTSHQDLITTSTLQQTLLAKLAILTHTVVSEVKKKFTTIKMISQTTLYQPVIYKSLVQLQPDKLLEFKTVMQGCHIISSSTTSITKSLWTKKGRKQMKSLKWWKKNFWISLGPRSRTCRSLTNSAHLTPEPALLRLRSKSSLKTMQTRGSGKICLTKLKRNLEQLIFVAAVHQKKTRMN